MIISKSMLHALNKLGKVAFCVGLMSTTASAWANDDGDNEAKQMAWKRKWKKIFPQYMPPASPEDVFRAIIKGWALDVVVSCPIWGYIDPFDFIDSRSIKTMHLV